MLHKRLCHPPRDSLVHFSLETASPKTEGSLRLAVWTNDCSGEITPFSTDRWLHSLLHAVKDLFFIFYLTFLCCARAVYLSGGVTMLPGFQERLHAELKKLAPPAVTVEVGTWACSFVKCCTPLDFCPCSFCSGYQ